MQCRAEIPHIQEMIKQFPDQPISWISVNTINPKKQADAEIKRYNIDFPVFYGRGQDMNKNFKVKKLPRLILIKEDGTVDQDVLFLKADELKVELERMLKEVGVDSSQKTNEMKKE
ncbi:MAG: TlpA disulfide reductase family protein [Calditrichota bacterium]